MMSAYGTVVFRVDGIEGLQIGAQIRQSHQPLCGSGRPLLAAEPLPLLQHEGDQGAEQRRVRRVFPGIFKAQETENRLLRVTDQGKGGKVPGLPRRSIRI